MEPDTMKLFLTGIYDRRQMDDWDATFELVFTHEVSFVNVASERSKRSERSEFVVRRVPSKTSACRSVRAYVRSFRIDLRNHSTDFYDFFLFDRQFENSDSKFFVFQFFFPQVRH